MSTEYPREVSVRIRRIRGGTETLFLVRVNKEPEAVNRPVTPCHEELLVELDKRIDHMKRHSSRYHQDGMKRYWRSGKEGEVKRVWGVGWFICFLLVFVCFDFIF